MRTRASPDGWADAVLIEVDVAGTIVTATSDTDPGDADRWRLFFPAYPICIATLPARCRRTDEGAFRARRQFPDLVQVMRFVIGLTLEDNQAIAAQLYVRC